MRDDGSGKGQGLIRESELQTLSEEIHQCRRCPRLVEYREKVARGEIRGFKGGQYWGRPVSGFGDAYARLLIIGLAPAAHGGNRTGRVFTGDATARFLMRAMYEAGFANQPTSESKNDGLVLRDAFMTAAVKCAPPDNKPSAAETSNCAQYLAEEIRLLGSVQAVLALGRFAFDGYVRHIKDSHKIDIRNLKFHHGAVYKPGRGLPILFASYHPTPRNTNTGLLTKEAFAKIFVNIREILSK
ncbi:MAG: uracil-DNA glycosylase [Thaumarchaeota archaeon]|nr:uracil-DNA glycosylase [Nitrososphaerota archaeon]